MYDLEMTDKECKGEVCFDCEVGYEISDCKWDKNQITRQTETYDLSTPQLGFSIKKNTIDGWRYPEINLYLWNKRYRLTWVSVITVNLKVTDWKISEE